MSAQPESVVGRVLPSAARQRAAREAGRLQAQASITMQAAIAAGEDLDREVSTALLVLDRWARRLAQPAP
jgi:hypothetical protein